MQPKTAPPREDLTEAEVDAVLTGDQVTVTLGLELLDTSNQLVADISDDLGEGCSIDWDNRNPIHGSCRMKILRVLAWGRDRLRPYVILSDGTTTARFNLGVYVPMTPTENRGEDPVTYDVSCYDLLSLLQTSGPVDTHVVESGTTYRGALQSVITLSGIGVTLQLDGDVVDQLVPATRVWAAVEPVPSWLRIMSDLLAEIGYVAPWVDPDGNIKSRPFAPIAERASEWTLDIGDTSTNIVEEDRSIAVEAGEVANSWRFVRSNMDVMPVLDAGIYVPADNQSEGPNSIDALGRTVFKRVRLEAADQDALIAQGDKIVAEDKASVRVVSLQIHPLPIMGFDDVFTLVDGDDTERLAAASWSMDLVAWSGRLQLGGAPPVPSEPIETQVKATVTSAAPLRVQVDGADVDSFANALDAAAYGIGDRVTVTARNPVPPLVQGIES